MPPQNKIMNYNIFKTSKLIATFELRRKLMKELKHYSKIMKMSSPFTSCQDMLIKTDKNKNIILILCNLSFKPITWEDGVTVKDQDHSFTVPLKEKSDKHFMHYAEKEWSGYNNVIMPVSVPPIADYNCDIYELNKSTKTGLIEMRTSTHLFTFRTQMIM